MRCNALMLARYYANRLSLDDVLEVLDHTTSCDNCQVALMQVARYERRHLYEPRRGVAPTQGLAKAIMQRLERVRLEPPVDLCLDDDTDPEFNDFDFPRKTVRRVADWIIRVLEQGGELETRTIAKRVGSSRMYVARTMTRLRQAGKVVGRRLPGSQKWVWTLAA